MLHDAFIALHAVAGVVCFAAAALSLRLTTTGSWRFGTYLGALVALIAFIVAAITIAVAGVVGGIMIMNRIKRQPAAE